MKEDSVEPHYLPEAVSCWIKLGVPRKPEEIFRG